MFKRYSILQRLSFVPFVQPKRNPVTGLEEAPAPVFHFNDDEVERLNALWDSAWIQQASHDKDGVRLLMQDGESVHIQRDKVTLSAKAEDATLRALVLHAKENWNNSFKPLSPHGDEELRARIWAHCQVHGVNFGWEPSPEMAKKMGPLIQHLRHEEAVGIAPSYGSEGLGYRPGFTIQEPVQIPRAGSQPNYAGLRMEHATALAKKPGVSPVAPAARRAAPAAGRGGPPMG